MRNKSKSKRTEAALSLLVTSALVITLSIAVASAIKKGTSNNENNMINLNETESQNLSADNGSKQNTPSKTQTPSSNSTTNNSQDSSSETVDGSDKTNTNLHEARNDSNETDFENINASDADKTSDASDSSDVPVVSGNSIGTGYSFSEADTLKMPVSGEIVLEYNMDNTIWFPTLGVYKCNPGIYIAGNIGTDVIASASGTVESITSNEELGSIVTINMGNGYKASYGQLGNIKVSEGEVVIAGSVIGTVAEPTIYYTMEGSGIYFKLTKNDVPENPLDYME